MTSQHDPVRRAIMVNLLNEDLGTDSQRKTYWRAGSHVAKELGFLPPSHRRKTHIPTNYQEQRNNKILHWIECSCGHSTIKRLVFVDCRREWINHRERAFQ